MPQIEIIRDIDELLQMEGMWNDVLSLTDDSHPFLSFEWFTSWWNCYGGNNELFVVMVKEQGEVIGILPFMKANVKFRAMPVRVIKFISNEHTNRAGMILLNNPEKIVGHVIEYFKESNENYDVILLDRIVNGSATDIGLKCALDIHGLKYRNMLSYNSPYISVDGDWEQYLKSRSKSLRKSIKRIRNLMNRQGKFEINTYTVEDIHSGINDMLAISKRSWKQQSNTAIASNPIDTTFYSSLAQKFSNAGWLELWTVRLQDRPIAFEFKIIYNNICYSLKTSYDKEYKKLSPSTFLDSFTIKDSFTKCHREYDLLGIETEYKMKWANSLRGHSSYWIFSNTLYGRLLALFELHAVPLLKRSRRLSRFMQRKMTSPGAERPDNSM